MILMIEITILYNKFKKKITYDFRRSVHFVRALMLMTLLIVTNRNQIRI